MSARESVQFVVMAFAATMAFACSAPAPTPPASNSLVAVLDRCQTSQALVREALDGSSIEATLSRLKRAEQDCHEAAVSLRAHPLPNTNNAMAADGVDLMATGLGKIARGFELLDRQPTRARRTAQAGMRDYEAGLLKLQAASS